MTSMFSIEENSVKHLINLSNSALGVQKVNTLLTAAAIRDLAARKSIDFQIWLE